MNTLPIEINRWIADAPEPGPVTAGILAVVVHIGFAAMLVLNMSWHKSIQPVTSVKLWESMPATKVKVTKKQRKPKSTHKPQPQPVTEAAPKPVAAPAETAPPPAPQLEVPPPAAAPMAPQADLAAPVREQIDQPPPDPMETMSAEPAPAPAPVPVEEQVTPQPEIDVEEMKRQRALALAQTLREQDDARVDNSLEKEREARIEQARQRQQEREQRLAQQLDEIPAPSTQPRNEPQAQQDSDAAAHALTEDYRARISARIRQRVILPPDMQGNPEAVYTVSLLPGGTVTQVQLLRSSGVPAYDAAVERAILAAQPLPVPEDPALFQANFKNLLLNFRPKE
ncbi:MAG: energy transducer TonB [Burkholderiales bacterium]